MKQIVAVCLAVFLSACATNYGANIPEGATSYIGSPETRAIVAGNTAFAVDVYGDLTRERAGNIFVSPASISTAFGLAYAGAEGETKAEIARVLHFDDLDETAFHPVMGQLLRDADIEGEAAILKINNALWVDRETVLEEDYTALTEEHYGARDFRVDYRNMPDAAGEEINDWVETQTNNRIMDLISAGDLTESTRSVLVNTIYMNADWQSPFFDGATEETGFTRLDGVDIEIPLMRQTEFFRHWQNRSLQLVELPYQGGELSMVILLPKRASGLPALEAALTPELLDGWLGALAASEVVEVDLELPKFKLEDKYKMVEEGILPRLGLQEATSNAADFSGAVRAERQPDFKAIKIDEVIHQTFVEVNEAGTEAAAATAIVNVVIVSARVGAPPPIPFHADHPFLFLIKDNRTGLVLFLGRIMEP